MQFAQLKKRGTAGGFTLTEAALVVLLIGVLLGGVIYYASKAFRDAQERKMVAQVTTLAANMKNYLAKQDNVPSIDTLINLHIVPPEMVRSGSPPIVYHALGGNIGISFTNTFSFTLSIKNVTASGCHALLSTYVTDADNSSSFDALSATIGNNNRVVNLRNALAADIVKAVPACSAFNGREGVSITYVTGN